MNICNVILKEKVKESLIKLPKHIVINLYEWIDAVSHDGLLEVRKISGYHDEPLKGNRKGQRSIRLSKAYRAIYEVTKNHKLDLVEIVEVNKHDYR
jgi:proteic killer suppression protein